jgi:hypothetical protein
VHAERDDRVAGVRRANERVAPTSGRAFARARILVAANDDRVVIDAGAVVERAFDRALDPRVERMIGRLEREKQECVAAVVGAGELRFERIQQPAVGGVEARLRDRTGGLDAAGERGEASRDRCPERRAVLETHPCLGDDAERSLRAEQHAIR